MSILGIGTTVIDRVVVLEQYPEPDTKQPILDSWTQVGGPVPVALATAARLGTETRLVSRWGQDHNGDLISRTLTARGIDLTFAQQQPGWNSGEAQIWVSRTEGTRTIAFHRGSFLPLAASDLDSAAFDNCRLLHLDGWSGEAALAAAVRMKQQRGTIVLDAGSIKPGMLELLPLVDVLVASKLFRSAHQKATGRELPDGVPSIICTKGADGATLITADDRVNLPGHTVDVVDTNGAGDIFSGAILHGLTQEWPMLKCVKFANETAAMACAERGNSLIVE